MATMDPASSSNKAEDRVTLTSVAELTSNPRNRTNKIRLHLVSLFCSAVYAVGGEASAASKLINDCLAVCGGSRELLSAMLQTRFLDDATPVYFILCNADRTKHTTLPPLLKIVLDQCTSPLSKAMVDEIQNACCQRNDDNLYQLIMAHPHFHGSCQEYGLPVAHCPSGRDIHFTIPNYPDRMLMGQDVELTAISKSRLLALRFHRSDGSWNLTIEPRIGYLGKHTKVNLYLTKPSTVGDCPIADSLPTYRGVVDFDVSFLRLKNDYLNARRVLSGKIS